MLFLQTYGLENGLPEERGVGELQFGDVGVTRFIFFVALVPLGIKNIERNDS